MLPVRAVAKIKEKAAQRAMDFQGIIDGIKRSWSFGRMTSKAVRNRVHDPTQCGTTVVTTRCTKGERKPVHAGSGLKPTTVWDDAA